MEDTVHRAGSCALVGAPNAGKSSLLNQLIGKHLCAVSPKPQTTRNHIRGVANWPDRMQVVFVDTPGAQDGGSPLRKFMRQQVETATADADVVALIIDATKTLKKPEVTLPNMLIILNKIDALKSKSQLLPKMEEVHSWGLGAAIPISAKTGDGIEQLVSTIEGLLPVGPPMFPPDITTDRGDSFLASELIREQAFLQLNGEIPYETAVVVEAWEDFDNGDIKLSASILVERKSQKAIVIGRQGSRIREIGTLAREAISKLFGCTVHLKLHVRVVDKWSSSTRKMQELGYDR